MPDGTTDRLEQGVPRQLQRLFWAASVLRRVPPRGIAVEALELSSLSACAPSPIRVAREPGITTLGDPVQRERRVATRDFVEVRAEPGHVAGVDVKMCPLIRDSRDGSVRREMPHRNLADHSCRVPTPLGGAIAENRLKLAERPPHGNDLAAQRLGGNLTQGWAHAKASDDEWK